MATTSTVTTSTAAPSSAAAGAAASTADQRTRARVQTEVSERGPITAAELAGLLGLTATAVRRHLDALSDTGLIEERDAARKGRGRPARAYVLTPAGHRALSTSYDDVATSALHFLAEQVGPQAVQAFAREHVAAVEDRYRERVHAAGPDVRARAEALAQALSEDGYAASSRSLDLPIAGVGLQLCQGHCPMQQVASEFPEFCEAEREVFSRLLGVHVQRLATLAGGEHVCTTFVPTTNPSTERPSR